ncbi:FtsW/RodA/SpoVE family cell cycle protein [uncultured Pseudokineococcus sp.]|uniref:FtsW/RodA/SpoVE family cell cycle protein n=1 Tax=uncultured Pseudokineococcus sp. TaxID=1642928 RepID=UPI00260FD282|nr:FtsW/RodA/SpoVE family cell cycle protein [uncultured Pseudokineococcus sp.]
MAVVTEHVARSRRGTELLLLLLSVGVAALSYGLVGLGVDGTWSPGVLWYGGGLAVLAGVVHGVLRWRAPYADPVLLPVAVALNGLGLAMIHRLDLAEGTAQGSRQLLWSAIGVVAATAVVIALRDHRVLRRYTFVAMAASLVLLLLPLLPFLGRTINGARIWIGIGPLSFQPGEIAKITLAVFFAGYLVTARDTLSLAGRRLLGLQLPRGRDLGPILVAWAGSVGVLVLQRDLGTSLLFFGLFVAVLYLATERVSWIAIGLALFAGGAYLAHHLFGHVQQRVSGWLDPFDPEVYDRAAGGSYQLVQGLFGFAAGGLTGTGLGRGRPDIVPFANSDFILASMGEELGLAGLFALLALYLVVVERGLRTAIGVRDGFGKLLAGGLAFTVALQCFVVAGGVLRVIPLTGLTMPFLAAGGSSLLTNWIIIGLLLRISDAARRPAPTAQPAPVGPATSETQIVGTV